MTPTTTTTTQPPMLPVVPPVVVPFSVTTGPIQGFLLLLLLVALLRRLGLLPDDVQDAILKLTDPDVAVFRLREWFVAVRPADLPVFDRLRVGLTIGTTSISVP
jgi:hypothetical protein